MCLVIQHSQKFCIKQVYQKQGNLKRFVPFVSTCPQGDDYAIILPEEEPSLEVIRDLEETSHDIFFSPKVYSKGGRDIIVPSIGLVTTRDKHLSVCFSYFQGKLAADVDLNYFYK